MCSRKADKHSKGSFKNLSACQMCNTRNHFAVQKNEREDFDQQPSSIFIHWGFDDFNGFHLRQIHGRKPWKVMARESAFFARHWTQFSFIAWAEALRSCGKPKSAVLMIKILKSCRMYGGVDMYLSGTMVTCDPIIRSLATLFYPVTCDPIIRSPATLSLYLHSTPAFHHTMVSILLLYLSFPPCVPLNHCLHFTSLFKLPPLRSTIPWTSFYLFI